MRIPAASILVLGLLAGCSSTPTEDPIPPAPTPEPVLDYVDCQEALAIIPVPPSQVEGSLPEGFTPTSLEGQGATAAVGIVAFACADTLVDGVSRNEPFGEVSTFAVAQPPEQFRDANVTIYAVSTGAIATAGAALDQYVRWGFDAREATTQTFEFTSPPIGRQGHVAVEADGRRVELDVFAGGMPAAEPAGMARVFAVRDGIVTGWLDVSFTASMGIESGLASVQASGIPVLGDGTPQPGAGAHYWGTGYAYHLEYTPYAAAPAAQ